MFERALREKFRFVSPTGLLSVEDLWDINITGRGTTLESIARDLSQKTKSQSDAPFSFMEDSVNSEDVAKLEIVKYIATTRHNEAESRKQEAAMRAEKSAKKDAILRALENRKMEDLNSKSAEELEEMIKNL